MCEVGGTFEKSKKGTGKEKERKECELLLIVVREFEDERAVLVEAPRRLTGPAAH